jgi:hypothetical protein
VSLASEAVETADEADPRLHDLSCGRPRPTYTSASRKSGCCSRRTRSMNAACLLGDATHEREIGFVESDCHEKS